MGGRLDYKRRSGAERHPVCGDSLTVRVLVEDGGNRDVGGRPG